MRIVRSFRNGAVAIAAFFAFLFSASSGLAVGFENLGDFVWKDLNKNGIQDVGEPGIPNVVVVLTDEFGFYITDAITDTNGRYIFYLLSPGTYNVEVYPGLSPGLTGLVPTISHAPGSTTVNDSNGAYSSTVTLTEANPADLTIDFGYHEPTVPGPSGSIGDFVWKDLNQNGIQDSLEPGIDGVAVRLYDNSDFLIATDVTDANGYYQFNDLPAGTYKVKADTASAALAGLVASPVAAPGGTPTNDSNPATSVVVLANDASTDQSIDFGFYAYVPPTGTIGDYVWLDLNQDGIQDLDEEGIDGVKVILKDGANNVLGTAVTAGGGAYLFDHLPAGNYSVLVDTSSPALAGFIPTYVAAIGSTSLDDSNPNPAAVTLATDSSSDLSIDFGYIPAPAGSIGDYVWKDLDGDGIQDAPTLEPGIPNVTVNLYGPMHTLLATTTTDADGYYLFTHLSAGTYTVEIANTLTLDGFVYALTTPTAPGSTSANDSNVNPATSVLPLNTSSDTSVDFGYTPVPAGKIGNFVWNDLNDNGIQDAGEPGINGVTVKLFGPGNVELATTTTSGNGEYLFTGLHAGSYSVVVDTASPALAGFIPTAIGAPGSNDDNDSNPTPQPVTLLSNTSVVLSVDFGYLVPTGRIGDFVWKDLNQNGVQDAGEPGINGVTVTLLGAGNAPIASTVTAGNGGYLFTGLTAGAYSVVVDESSPALAGLIATSIGAGTVSTDHNGSPAPVILPSNIASDLTIDFGYLVPGGQIGDFVWKDLNQNGIQDAGEPGINGVTVRLFGPGNVLLATTVTAGNGGYLFGGLAAGNYTVAVDAGSLPLAGTTPTLVNAPGSTPANDSDGSPVAVNLPTHKSINLTVDFGYIPAPAGSIGDFVWRDFNGDGIQNGAEPGIPGVTVRLLSASNVLLATQVTDGSGLYLFTGLQAGTYKVAVDNASPALAGWTPTASNAPGSTTSNDSNPNPFTVTLPLNISSDMTVDFGFKEIPVGQIGDFVWKDINKDGIQNSGEPGINGVTVKLLGPGNTLLATTVTAGNGGYLFTGLSAGTYSVVVDGSSPALAGLTPTAANAPGSTISNDSSTSPVSVTLATNSTVNLTIDFGFKQVLAGRIGNFVWKDVNRNGIQDSGEPGINGVRIILKDAGGNVLATTLTAGNGAYLFSGLSAGTYIVEVDEADTDLNGLQPTFENAAGSTTANDSNGNPTEVILATNTSEDLTIDFGFIVPGCGCIGNRVWKDLDCDGIQDCNEPGIQGVTVQLYWNGNLIDTEVTDCSGRYSFCGLWAGCYTVVIDNGQPALNGLIPTKVNAGSNPGYDSNPNPASVCLATNKSCDSSIDFGYKKGPTGPLTTYTQGGWGAKPSGNNPGTLLANNFSEVYPNGLIVGGCYTLKFTSAKAIENFLPSGGTPSKLTKDYVNPTTSLGTLAGNVVALRLSVDFSNAGETALGLKNAKFKTGKFAGKTVGYLLTLAESVLGGGALPNGISYSDVNEACALVLENYDNGTNTGKMTP
jgi:protocatechuate 3,4-dioxygenase beta subunit